MLIDPNNVLYLYVILYGIYGMILAPYIGAKIFTKLGKNERFWFYSLLFLNVYLFIGILFYPDFWEKVPAKDKFKIYLLIAGYLLIFSLILWF